MNSKKYIIGKTNSDSNRLKDRLRKGIDFLLGLDSKKRVEAKYNIDIIRTGLSYRKLEKVLTSNMDRNYELAKNNEKYRIFDYYRSNLPQLSLLIFNGFDDFQALYHHFELVFRHYDFSLFYGNSEIVLLEKYLLNDFIFHSFMSLFCHFVPFKIDFYFAPSIRDFLSPYKTTDVAILTINFDSKFLLSHRKRFLNDFDIWNAIAIKQYDSADKFNFFKHPNQKITNLNIYQTIRKFSIIQKLDPYKWEILRAFFMRIQRTPKYRWIGWN